MRRALHVAVLTAFVLGTACDSDVQGVLDEIKKETKVDLRDPAQVALAASGADAMGNKDAEDGLDVVKGFRRAEHESRGDRLRLNKEYRKARAEYKEALRWTEERGANLGPITIVKKREPDPKYEEQVLSKRADLEWRIGLTHESEAEDRLRTLSSAQREQGGDVVVRRMRYQAAAKYAAAGDTAPTAASKKYFYYDAALQLQKAGELEQACLYYQKAGYTSRGVPECAGRI